MHEKLEEEEKEWSVAIAFVNPLKVRKVEYPQDFFVNLESDENRLGRITLNLHGETFTVEIDIVQKESRKIWRHVDSLYKVDGRDDALQLGVQRLSRFLQGGG